MFSAIPVFANQLAITPVQPVGGDMDCVEASVVEIREQSWFTVSTADATRGDPLPHIYVACQFRATIAKRIHRSLPLAYTTLSFLESVYTHPKGIAGRELHHGGKVVVEVEERRERENDSGNI